MDFKKSFDPIRPNEYSINCDNISNKEEFQEAENVILSRKVRILIFCLFLVLSIVVDLDNGIFSSSVDVLAKDLGMNNTEYGTFVSVSFIGRIIGLVFFMVVINFKHRKFTLTLTIALHGSSYIFYKITTNAWILIFAKMFAAAMKVCASVYRPVWIEQFGLSNYKSIFFSLVQVMSSYGQVIGFNLGSLYFKGNWKLALIYVMIIMLVIALFFALIPGKYFYRSYMYYGEKLVETDDDTDNDKVFRTLSSLSDISERASVLSSSSTSSKKKKQTIFVNSKTIKELKDKKYNFKSLLRDLWILIKNKIFILSIIRRSITTFVFQIIHSYLKVYQEKVLKGCNKKLLVLFYNIASLVATAIGGLIGGVLTKCVGGYESKKSVIVLLIPEFVTSVNIFFLSFTKDFYIYNINLILFFFFISSNSPIILGYLIKTIPQKIKGVGVGLDMIVSTFLGKIPSPIIYGALEDKYSSKKPDLAWKISLSYYYLGIIVAIILCIFKCKEEIEIHEEKREVTVVDQIADIAAIGSGSDVNGQFKLRVPVPKRSKTVCKKKTELEISLVDNAPEQ